MREREREERMRGREREERIERERARERGANGHLVQHSLTPSTGVFRNCTAPEPKPSKLLSSMSSRRPFASTPNRLPLRTRLPRNTNCVADAFKL